MTTQDDVVRECYKLRPHARKFCRDHDRAEDLIHETALKGILNLDKFGGENLAAWLYVIMRNTYYSDMKRVYRHRETEDPDGEIAARTASPAPQHAALELKELFGLMAKIPHWRASLVMFRAMGYEYWDLADALDIKHGTVKSGLRRGRVALEKLMEGENYEDIVRFVEGLRIDTALGPASVVESEG